jgi:hypothetical protein
LTWAKLFSVASGKQTSNKSLGKVSFGPFGSRGKTLAAGTRNCGNCLRNFKSWRQPFEFARQFTIRMHVVPRYKSAKRWRETIDCRLATK